MGRPKLSDLICTVCNASFKKKCFLDEHMEKRLCSAQSRREHNHEKNYCDTHKKSFNDPDKYEVHVKMEHPLDTSKINRNNADDTSSCENRLALQSKRNAEDRINMPKEQLSLLEYSKFPIISLRDFELEPVDWAEYQNVENKTATQKKAVKVKITKVNCSICGEQCKTRKELRVHMITHTKSRQSSKANSSNENNDHPNNYLFQPVDEMNEKFDWAEHQNIKNKAATQGNPKNVKIPKLENSKLSIVSLKDTKLEKIDCAEHQNVENKAAKQKKPVKVKVQKVKCSVCGEQCKTEKEVRVHMFTHTKSRQGSKTNSSNENNETVTDTLNKQSNNEIFNVPQFQYHPNSLGNQSKILDISKFPVQPIKLNYYPSRYLFQSVDEMNEKFDWAEHQNIEDKAATQKNPKNVKVPKFENSKFPIVSHKDIKLQTIDCSEHQNVENKLATQKNLIKVGVPKLKCSVCGVQCKTEKGLRLHMITQKKCRQSSKVSSDENNEAMNDTRNVQCNNINFLQFQNHPNNLVNVGNQLNMLNNSPFQVQPNNLVNVGNHPNILHSSSFQSVDKMNEKFDCAQHQNIEDKAATQENPKNIEIAKLENSKFPIVLLRDIKLEPIDCSERQNVGNKAAKQKKPVKVKVRKVKCSICGEQCKTEKKLRVHMITHTKSRQSSKANSSNEKVKLPKFKTTKFPIFSHGYRYIKIEPVDCAEHQNIEDKAATQENPKKNKIPKFKNTKLPIVSDRDVKLEPIDCTEHQNIEDETVTQENPKAVKIPKFQNTKFPIVSQRDIKVEPIECAEHQNIEDPKPVKVPKFENTKYPIFSHGYRYIKIEPVDCAEHQNIEDKAATQENPKKVKIPKFKNSKLPIVSDRDMKLEPIDCTEHQNIEDETVTRENPKAVKIPKFQNTKFPIVSQSDIKVEPIECAEHQNIEDPKPVKVPKFENTKYPIFSHGYRYIKIEPVDCAEHQNIEDKAATQENPKKVKIPKFKNSIVSDRDIELEQIDGAEHQNVENKLSAQKNLIKVRVPKLKCSVCGIQCKTEKGLRLHMITQKKCRQSSKASSDENNEAMNDNQNVQSNNINFPQFQKQPNNLVNVGNQSNLLNISPFQVQPNNLVSVGNNVTSVPSFGNPISSPINSTNQVNTQFLLPLPNQNTLSSVNIPKFDCNSETYMKWLKNFVTKCKDHGCPLNTSLCKKISLVTDEIMEAVNHQEYALKQNANHFAIMNMYNILAEIMLNHMQHTLRNANK